MSLRAPNIYLIGLPGSGKTTVGRLVAERLAQDGYRFVDIDAVIEQRCQLSIPQIFEGFGEQAFRDLEMDVLEDVATSDGRPYVVATGGGVVVSRINRVLMTHSGRIVWLNVPIDELTLRIARDESRGIHRPLFSDTTDSGIAHALERLSRERTASYRAIGMPIAIAEDCVTSAGPEQVAHEILVRFLSDAGARADVGHAETIVARSALRRYDIVLNADVVRLVCDTVLAMGRSEIFLLTDEHVASLYGTMIRELLAMDFGSGSSRNTLHVLAASEESKSWDTSENVIDKLAESQASRKRTAFVAMGGGVITDLGGFVASVYQRGLDVISIPTTYLAQIDAAIGGKTGVNRESGKNQIGTFYPPVEVLIDSKFLETLPRRELMAGLGELLKYGIISGRQYWDAICQQLPKMIDGKVDGFARLTAQAVRVKLSYVEPDEFEREQGVREVLNLGHTFAHALEAATGYSAYRHGEAVLLGLRTAAWLSNKLDYLDVIVFQEIEDVLRRVPIGTRCDVDQAALLYHIKSDKKRGAQTRVLLFRAIGDVFVTDVTDADCMEAMMYLAQLAR